MKLLPTGEWLKRETSHPFLLYEAIVRPKCSAAVAAVDQDGGGCLVYSTWCARLPRVSPWYSATDMAGMVGHGLLRRHPHHLGQHQTHHFRQHPEITHSSHFGRSLWVTRISSLWATRKTSFLSSHYLTQPFRVWLGGVGGDKSVIDAGNKGGIHALKSSLDSAI